MPRGLLPNDPPPLTAPVRVVEKAGGATRLPPSKWKQMPLSAAAAKLQALMPRRKEYVSRRQLAKSILRAFEAIYGAGTQEFERAWAEWAEWATPPKDPKKYSRVDLLPTECLMLVAVGLIDRHISNAKRPEPWPDRHKYMSRPRASTFSRSPPLPIEPT